MDALNIKEFDNAGAMVILGLLVFRLPAIVTAFNTGVQLIINNIISVQDKAIKAFTDQMNQDREMHTQRFERIETSLQKMTDALNISMGVQNKILDNQNRIEGRVESLENRSDKQ